MNISLSILKPFLSTVYADCFYVSLFIHRTLILRVLAQISLSNIVYQGWIQSLGPPITRCVSVGNYLTHVFLCFFICR